MVPALLLVPVLVPVLLAEPLAPPASCANALTEPKAIIAANTVQMDINRSFIFNILSDVVCVVVVM